jgi:hypothetical protein
VAPFSLPQGTLPFPFFFNLFGPGLSAFLLSEEISPEPWAAMQCTTPRMAADEVSSVAVYPNPAFLVPVLRGSDHTKHEKMDHWAIALRLKLRELSLHMSG